MQTTWKLQASTTMPQNRISTATSTASTTGCTFGVLTFNGTADGIYLEVQGGIAHGWTAWLNGRFIGSFLGNISSSVDTKEITFPNGITDHNQGSGSLNIRGIVNATLLDSQSGFSSWRDAGTAGGANRCYARSSTNSLQRGWIDSRTSWGISQASTIRMASSVT
jgi:hypothetical protein